MTSQIDLWITGGSTYTYLTLNRLADAERAHGVAFRLRPFYLGKIFDDIGRWPFPDGAEKTRYMWRDIERRAVARGLSPKLPAPYPAPNSVLVNQVAALGLRQDWSRDFLLQSYRHWFEDGLLPGDQENLSASLSAVGQDVDTILKAVETEGVHESLIDETGIAQRLGVFGAPMFTVGQELFWGDDRLEDAVAWAKANPD